jgi:hypothetical protein
MGTLDVLPFPRPLSLCPGFTALKVTATVRFCRPVRLKEVAVLRAVLLVVLPIIKEIQN